MTLIYLYHEIYPLCDLSLYMTFTFTFTMISTHTFSMTLTFVVVPPEVVYQAGGSSCGCLRPCRETEYHTQVSSISGWSDYTMDWITNIGKFQEDSVW